MDGVIIQVLVKPEEIQDTDVDAFSEFLVGISFFSADRKTFCSDRTKFWNPNTRKTVPASPGSSVFRPASGHGRPKSPAYLRDNREEVLLGRFQYLKFRPAKDPAKRR